MVEQLEPDAEDRLKRFESDQLKRKILKEGLEGHWEYICEVTSKDSTFVDGMRGRGGRMTINVKEDYLGMATTIEAQRLWATPNPEDDKAKKPMPTAIFWSAKAAVQTRDDSLSFEYYAGDEEGIGVTRDKFQIFESNREFFLHPGTFTQRDAQGRIIKGIVKLRKMDHAKDFQWAPKGIKVDGATVKTGVSFETPPTTSDTKAKTEYGISITGGTVVFGDVGGDVVSGKMQKISIEAQNIDSLKSVFRTMQIPDEDIEEIEAIVKEENPDGENLGKRAAGWVGRMLANALTGDWEIGKYVSATNLQEILLRYYGVSS